jgi:hypothetical protein
MRAQRGETNSVVAQHSGAVSDDDDGVVREWMRDDHRRDRN